MSNTHLHIPASKDTLFMRGFSCRQDIDQIREYFAEKCGKNTVEFFKEDGNNQLFLALRFESKDVAKDVLTRYNEKEILGDRISMTWYKDLRRARPYNDYRRQPYRGNYGGDQYDQYKGYQRYQKSHYQRTSSGGRMKRYSRSSSRSRSASRSPTHSRSRSRSSSRSYESKDFKNRKEGMEFGNKRRRSGMGKKRHMNEMQQRGYESSDSHMSPRGVETAAGISPLKSSKKLNDSLDRQQPFSPKRMKPSTLVRAPQPPPMDQDQSVAELDQSIDGADYAYENSPAKPSKVPKSSVQKKVAKLDEKQQSEWLPVDTQVVDSTPTVFSAKKTPQVNQQLQNMIREQAANQNKETPTSNKTPIPMKKVAVEERKMLNFEEERSDLGDAGTVQPAFQHAHHATGLTEIGVNIGNSAGQPGALQAGLRTINKSTKDVPASRNTGSDSRMQVYDPMDNEMSRHLKKREMMQPEQHHEEDAEAGMSDGGMHGSRLRFDGFESSKRMKRGGGGGGDSEGRDGRSLMGLSHNKMILIKDKKEEVEKAYRSDCETFATVTKLLISKDPELEDRIQNSLRENLREIGYRCIQELREYVDRIKAEDDC